MAVLAAGGAAVFGMMWTDHRAANFSRAQDLFIWPDTPVHQVFSSLVDSGTVIRPASLKRALRHECDDLARKVSILTLFHRLI